MGEGYTPVKGDRVRVVLEGIAYNTEGRYGFSVSGSGAYHPDANLVSPDAEHVVSIEKIGPPVVTFKPGDVLRGLGLRDLYITVAKGGYVNHRVGAFYPSEAVLTSEHYELVDIGS